MTGRRGTTLGVVFLFLISHWERGLFGFARSAGGQTLQSRVHFGRPREERGRPKRTALFLPAPKGVNAPRQAQGNQTDHSHGRQRACRLGQNGRCGFRFGFGLGLGFRFGF